jgi:hypothetical protein
MSAISTTTTKRREAKYLRIKHEADKRKSRFQFTDQKTFWNDDNIYSSLYFFLKTQLFCIEVNEKTLEMSRPFEIFGEFL